MKPWCDEERITVFLINVKKMCYGLIQLRQLVQQKLKFQEI